MNVDTGKMAWYYQTSPHDTHDWDSAQTPVLVDAPINGQPRKLVSTAARNGYFFTLDRVDRRAPRDGERSARDQLGEAASTTRGGPSAIRRRIASIAGSLVSPSEAA